MLVGGEKCGFDEVDTISVPSSLADFSIAFTKMAGHLGFVQMFRDQLYIVSTFDTVLKSSNTSLIAALVY